MASKTEPGEPVPGQHVCPHCAKPFARLCDLNKHAKSHSRPFKCAIQTCKYHEHGWPTAKELERHINDKHSAAPRTFACRFPPCTYKSKRESNCKQHMEKTHRWKYIRSKSNGKHISGHHQDAPDHRLHIPSAKAFSAMSSPNISLGSPHQDFVLYPYENDASIMLEDEDDGDISYDPPRGQESQVYLPWTSPTTRIRRNENFLETFSQTYNGAPDRPAGSTDILIDPSLPQYTSADLSGPEISDPANIYTSQPLVKTELVNTAAEQIHMGHPDSRRGSLSGGPHYKREIPVHAIPTAAYPISHREQPMISIPTTTDRRISYSSSKPVLSRRRIGEEEESDDDNQSPQKRRKSNPVENFSDTDMPDIFRFAHPRIYDRDQKEKFSPCHSSHRDISTLVRHLSRPAHRLQVTDRFISSFDVNDPEYRHPRLGLCRRCWLAFPDREDFEDHISQTCDKVSKGKREKWRILLENFTPLINHSDEPEQVSHPLASEQRRVSVGSRRPSNVHIHAEHLPSPASAPFSSATIGMDILPQAPNPGFVPMNEHLKLQKEHRTLCQEHRVLRQKHQQLIQTTRALIQRQSYQDASAQRSGGNLWALSLDQSSHKSDPKAAARSSDNSKDTASDQESLVLHMDSQPTDVDIQGLMNEAPESLSRQNSGLTAMSRSTVHHVPTSPPPLPSEDDRSDECEEGDEFADGETREPSPNRRPPPSIPDSAYHTDPRRGSLGDQGCCGGEVAHGSSELVDPLLTHGSLVGSKMNNTNMGSVEIPMNRRKPAVAAPAVVGSTDDEMLPIVWSNPWGGGNGASAAAVQPTAAANQSAAIATTMAHHTFVNNGETAAAAAAPSSSSGEAVPNFDFFHNMNMDLDDHFDWMA